MTRKDITRGAGALVAAVVVAAQLGGCPTGVNTLQYVAGGTGQVALLSDKASVNVLTPAGDLSITGGTPVEVNWQAFATTNFSTLDVIIDIDQTPDNGNEITAYSGLPLTETKALIDTTRLLQGTYLIGVVMREAGNLVAFGYAPGRIIIGTFSSLLARIIHKKSERFRPLGHSHPSCKYNSGQPICNVPIKRMLKTCRQSRLKTASISLVYSFIY